MAGVRLKQLTKRFGDAFAVSNVSLEVKDTGFLVLLGPSGCGKTTILRCIAGLETPDEGEIYIGDKLVNDVAPKDRDIAMVFQNFALYPHMSVFDNIAFPLQLRKLAQIDIKRKVKEATDLLKITHLTDRKPKKLSGGEAQRVALARAIVRDPKVFLMDEPLSSLDAKLRMYMRAELKKLQKELGVTTIYVTHDQVEAMTMADKVAILDKGTLQQMGDVHEIFHHPSNLFVAGFIGSPPMNFMDCSLIEKKGSYFLEFAGFVLPISQIDKKIEEKTNSSELILGVRPIDVFLTKEKTPESIVEADVYLTEPMGEALIVDLKVVDSLVRASTAPDSMINMGEKLWMGFNMKKIYLFDKKTTTAIV